MTPTPPPGLETLDTSGLDDTDWTLLRILTTDGGSMNVNEIAHYARTDGDLLRINYGDINRRMRGLQTRGFVTSARPRHRDSGRRLARRYKLTDPARTYLIGTP